MKGLIKIKGTSLEEITEFLTDNEIKFIVNPGRVRDNLLHYRRNRIRVYDSGKRKDIKENLGNPDESSRECDIYYAEWCINSLDIFEEINKHHNEYVIHIKDGCLIGETSLVYG